MPWYRIIYKIYEIYQPRLILTETMFRKNGKNGNKITHHTILAVCIWAQGRIRHNDG